MAAKRPLQALFSLGVVAFGFVAPWQLGMLTPEVDLPQVSVALASERVVTIVMPLQAEPLELVPMVEDEESASLIEPDVSETPELVDALKTPSDPELPVDRDPQDASADAGDAQSPAQRVNAVPFPGMVRGPGSLVPGRPAGTSDGSGDNTEHVRRTRAPRKAPKTTSRECEPDRVDIFMVSETAYRIEDQAIAYYAEHPKEAEKLAATWWAKDDDGERRGFKLGRIKCGSILDQVGFKSGDIIEAVNGREIQSYSEAVTAFMGLRNRKVLWVQVERRGEPVRLDFHLVDEGEAQVEEGEEIVDPTALVEAELADPSLLDRMELWGDEREERRDERQDRKQERLEKRDKRRKKE
ncbi:MAG: hypothetical protein ACI9VR_000834 [Cognaticolwellia sp.]|jgi:hypothetical protein